MLYQCLRRGDCGYSRTKEVERSSPVCDKVCGELQQESPTPRCHELLSDFIQSDPCLRCAVEIKIALAKGEDLLDILRRVIVRPWPLTVSINL